jgi:uncharacterized protein YndB with AHSA1/START domain
MKMCRTHHLARSLQSAAIAAAILLSHELSAQTETGLTSPLIIQTVVPFHEAPLPGETHELAIMMIFNAPVEAVWKAWSEPEYLKQWWGPHGFTAPVADVDFRVGGTSLVAMSSPEFGTFYSSWMYTKIVPMERIEFIHRFADETGRILDPVEAGLPMPNGIPSEVPHVITIRQLDDGRTEMTVMEQGYTTAQAVELSRMGLEQSLEKMADMFHRQYMKE